MDTGSEGRIYDIPVVTLEDPSYNTKTLSLQRSFTNAANKKKLLAFYPLVIYTLYDINIPCFEQRK